MIFIFQLPRLQCNILKQSVGGTEFMESQMKLLLLAVALALPTFASASCFGSGSYQTCTDSSGNSYSVQRYGNTTYTQGYSGSTGNSWSQTSSTYGSTTYHNGTAANGNSWSGTSSTYGGTTTYQGIDSRGNFYNRTCNAYGCN